MPTPIPNIWQMQSQGDVEGLTSALRHPDAGVRQRSAAALRAIGAWHAVPALENALQIESDWKAHAAISAAIAYLDRDIHIEQMVKSKDVRGLTKMLSSSRLDDVITAARALGDIGDRLATEALIIVFRNPFAPSKARLAAAEALLKLESAPAVATLLRALRRDDWAVRRNAAAVLGQLQATWAVEPLIEALKDPVPIVRKTAEAALQRMNIPEAVEALKAYEQNNRQTGTRPLADAPAAQAPASQAVKTPRPDSRPLIITPPSTVEPRRVEPAATPQADAKPKTEAAPTPPAPVPAPSEAVKPVVPPEPPKPAGATPPAEAAPSTELPTLPPSKDTAPAADAKPTVEPPPPPAIPPAGSSTTLSQPATRPIQVPKTGELKPGQTKPLSPEQ